MQDTPQEAYCTICNKEMTVMGGKCLDKELVSEKCNLRFVKKRKIAFAIDWAVLTIIWLTGIFLAEVSFSDLFVRPAEKALHDSFAYPFVLWTCISEQMKFISLLWIVLFSLFLVRDGWKGIFFGKRIMGLQVVRIENGEPISCLQSFYRNAFFLLLPIAGPIYYNMLIYVYMNMYCVDNDFILIISWALIPHFLITPYFALYVFILIVGKIWQGLFDKLTKTKVVFAKHRGTSPFVPGAQVDSED